MNSKGSSMAAKFVIRQDGSDRYLIVLQTHSGQVVLTSEVHKYKDVALSRISAMRSLARNDKNYVLRTEESGACYFMIRNANGEILGLSDMYPDRESLEKAINLVKGIARGARLEDLTVPPTPPKFRKPKKV
jgi:uncharacterized protein YegP (UPF0339 family)